MSWRQTHSFDCVSDPRYPEKNYRRQNLKCAGKDMSPGVSWAGKVGLWGRRYIQGRQGRAEACRTFKCLEHGLFWDVFLLAVL